nr:hypothetical protein [Sphingobium sp.]
MTICHRRAGRSGPAASPFAPIRCGGSAAAVRPGGPRGRNGALAGLTPGSRWVAKTAALLYEAGGPLRGGLGRGNP